MKNLTKTTEGNLANWETEIPATLERRGRIILSTYEKKIAGYVNACIEAYCAATHNNMSEIFERITIVYSDDGKKYILDENTEFEQLLISTQEKHNENDNNVTIKFTSLFSESEIKKYL